MESSFLIAIGIAAVISFGATPQVVKWFKQNGWVEDPGEKQKKTGNATAEKPVPRGGGLPIFLGMIMSTLLLLPLDKKMAGILLAATLTIIVGLRDDIADLSPKVRLITNLLAALIVVGCGIGISYISNPFGGVIDLSWPRVNFDFFGQHSIWIISDILAIFWIVWCMNIVGWSCGVDGQMPGFVATAAIFIGLLGIRYAGDRTEWPVIILAGAVAGAYLGFWPHNFYPQKIMPGYSGKSLAGLMLAVLSILSGAKVATLVILLGIPMLDAVWVLGRRLIKGKSLILGGGEHLHHQLLKLGWGKRRISLFYWGMTLILGLISLGLNSQQKLYLVIALAIFFAGLVLKVYRRI